MSSPKRADKPYGSRITTNSPAWLAPLEADNTGVTESRVRLEEIHLPTRQPRRYFDPEAMRALVESIRQHGILQPILVRPLEAGGYELVAGERRYRAATEVGLTEVPVVIRELSQEAAFQLALIENLQREDLNPVEETEGILYLLAIQLERAPEEVPPLLHRLQKERQLRVNPSDNNVIVSSDVDEVDGANNVIVSSDVDEVEATSEAIVASEIDSSLPRKPVVVRPELPTVEAVFNGLGLMTWESFVNNRLPLLNLPLDVLEVLRRGEIEYTKAKAISQIKNEVERSTFLSEAINHHLSLSQIKAQIKALQPQSEPAVTKLPERLKGVTQQIKKTRLWEDPKKRKQLEALLLQLEALVAEK